MNIQENVILAPYTTFDIGGPADYFIVAHSAEELQEAVRWAKDPSVHSGQELPFFILGKGANILIGDKGFRGVVIKNEACSVILNDSEGSKKDSSQAQNDSVLLVAESGATIENLINLTAERGLSGLEHFAGIPSTLGGALWQNLHFLSPDRSHTIFIGDIVKSAKILTSSAVIPSEVEGSFEKISLRISFGRNDMEIVDVDKNYFQFGYDFSTLHTTHDVVLSATLQLTPEDPAIIKERIAANLKWRQEKHPENAAKCSAGSVFKKIESYGAGRLIEQIGFKGKQIGGAKISEHHANFIINTGNATAKDVRELIELVQKTVAEKLELKMQTEISFIGEF